MRRLSIFVIVVLCAAASCRPELDERESLLTRTRILAVRGEPAEAKPGETVRFTVLVASPEGLLVDPPAAWAFCAAPKLLTENGAASAACLGDGVRPIANGPPATEAAIPTDACALFGPEIASADLRPRDPDVTGGYFQPLRVTVAVAAGGEPDVAFGLERIACRLANAAAETAADFGRRYTANANPELGPIALFDRSGAPVSPEAVPRRASIRIRASWPEESAERYVVYDLASRALVDRRESLRVSWYATAGSFASDRTGRAAEEPETFSDNVWSAPEDARTTHLFAVLRDARGGVTWATTALVTR